VRIKHLVVRVEDDDLVAVFADDGDVLFAAELVTS
jgi:hypothetical protein